MTLEEGESRRDEGMDRTLSRTDPEWIEAVAALVTERDAICACDVLDLIGPAYDMEGNEKPNSMGAQIRASALSAGMAKVGYHRSPKPSRHASMHALWARPLSRQS